jgi:hypothetical protein
MAVATNTQVIDFGIAKPCQFPVTYSLPRDHKLFSCGEVFLQELPNAAHRCFSK